MANQTITFSKRSGGWTSFWSYAPDWMLGMNSSFYTWKDGSLYKHDTNSIRNQFYGVNYSSTINTTFSQDPLTVKMYKTLSLDSNRPWETEIVTDMSTGEIAASYYEEKEGEWYGYIRRYDDGSYDTLSLSTQGIGSLLSYSSLTLNFSFNIGSSISQGDKVYKVSANSLVLIGTIASHSLRSITIVSLTGSAPTAGDMIVYVKNSAAESYGARGYYMDISLTNSDTTEVEIFSISSNVFKSFT
jgi:hypothetical protein